MTRKDRRIVLLVPPKGMRTRTFRVRLFFLWAAVVLCLVGFAGYVIPFNTLTLDVMELNQRRNLTRKNIELLHTIRGLRELLASVDQRLTAVSSKQEELREFTDFSASRSTSSQRHPPGHFAGAPEKLVQRLATRHQVMNHFAGKIRKDGAFFEKIPVLAPVRDSAQLSTPFGRARDPFTGVMKDHLGLDFVAPRGTPVIATASGVVSRIDRDHHFGLRIKLSHEFGFTTVYAHLGKSNVFRGKRVRRGDVIGTVGTTGVTTGPHVHYELHIDGRPVDPEQFLFPPDVNGPDSALQLVAQHE